MPGAASGKGAGTGVSGAHRTAQHVTGGRLGSSRSGSDATLRETTGSRVALAALWILLAMAAVLIGTGPAQAARQNSGPTSGAAETGNILVPGESSKTSTWGTVRAVHDAKSLAVTMPELTVIELRLLGVEPPVPPREGRNGIPSTPGQPFGPQAEKYLRDLLVDKQVRFDAYGKDRSGRTLAVVWLGDINVNLSLVKEGLAWVSPNLPNVTVRAELEVAERQAQVGKYGLWALPIPEAPWKYRQRHRLPAE